MAANQKPQRRSLRLKEFDYSQEGAYFITVCTWNWRCIFGEIMAGEMRLNESGKVVEHEWSETEKVRAQVKLDYYVIMPNHFHGIFFIQNPDRATHRVAPTGRKPFGPASGSVGAIMGQFKSKATKRINELWKTSGARVWQRNYYEHVIRDDDDLNRIRQYIIDNPARWQEDENYPGIL
jgi:putative transposase